MSELQDNFNDLKKYFRGLFKLHLHMDKCRKAEWILEEKIKDLMEHISGYTNQPELWRFWIESELTNKEVKE